VWIGNSLRLAGKILILVKRMALTIYAKAGLLRPRPKTLPQGQGQEFAVTMKTKATNFGKRQGQGLTSLGNKCTCWVFKGF